MKITKSKLEGYHHIYTLNGFTLKSKANCLYKYMNFEQLVRMVQNQELIFVSPEKWRDPFERRFYRTDYERLNFSRPDIACMCSSSKSTTNEEASWKMYTNSADKPLRLSIDYAALCKVLDQYAEENNCKVYIGNVIYDFMKSEIEALHKSSNKNHAIFFPASFDIEHYLSLMLIKRLSFQFENEVRLFIVHEKSLDMEQGLLKIENIDYRISRLISQIMLGPYEPLAEEDIRSSFKKKMNNIESTGYKTILTDLIGCKVKQSLLYSHCNPLVKI